MCGCRWLAPKCSSSIYTCFQLGSGGLSVSVQYNMLCAYESAWHLSFTLTHLDNPFLHKQQAWPLPRALLLQVWGGVASSGGGGLYFPPFPRPPPPSLPSCWLPSFSFDSSCSGGQNRDLWVQKESDFHISCFINRYHRHQSSWLLIYLVTVNNNY